MDTNQSSSFKKYLLIALGIIILMIIWVKISSPMIATVTGTGKIDVAADSISLPLTIISTDQIAKNAIDLSVAKAGRIRTTMIAYGIPEKDILESQVTVTSPTNGTGGYQAAISMGAVSTKIGTINDLISKLYEDGATSISQPYLTADKQSELENKALALALDDAKTKANDIARKNWKIFKRVAAIASQSSGNNSTATAKLFTQNETQNINSDYSFKIVVSVSVNYQMW